VVAWIIKGQKGDELHSANESEALKERNWGEVLSLSEWRNGEAP